MKIQKAELTEKLNRIKGVVPRNPTMKVLQGILVKDGYLIASNTELTIKAKIEGIGNESFIIPDRAFDLINNLPDGEVNIYVKAGNSVTIEVDKIKNIYQTLDPEQFPLNDAHETENRMTIEAKTLIESIKRVSYAVPVQGKNAVMSSMCLQAAGGYLNFVGLDGHVLAWDKVRYDGEFELLIPKNTADRLKSIGLSGDVQISYSRTGAIFITEDFEIYTRLVDGEYFKYQTLFTELPLHTVMSRKKLLDAITRAKMCTEERCPVRFYLDGDFLSLSLKDSKTDYSETLDLQETMTRAFTIGFDARLVLETIKAFDSDNLRLSFSDPKQPMIVETEASDFKAIVLPVNLG